MNNYKQLFPWYEEQNVSIKSISFDSDYLSRMNLGISLNGMKTPVAKLKNNKGVFTDFIFNSTIEIIVSERVKLFLENNENNNYLEFFPIEFRDKNIPTYFVLNVLEFIDAFDWKNSEYELFDKLGPKGNKVIRKMIKMKIDDKKTNGRKIFTMKDFFGSIFIHQSLIDKMIAEKFTGFKTQPLIGN